MATAKTNEKKKRKPKVGSMNRGQVLYFMGRCKKNGDVSSTHYLHLKKRLSELGTKKSSKKA
jgi:hypothetical protein